MQSRGILLVEDDSDDQEFFITALSGIKNIDQFEIANNGKEAIEILAAALVPPRLIFMDINMPVMNGIECLSEVLKNPQTRNIPVVMLSTSVVYREQVLKIGAKAFIEKPRDIEKLRGQLERIVNLEFGKYEMHLPE